MPPKKNKISAKTENTAAADTFSLDSLNFDCLQNIIQYLPIKDRIAVERVSKLWNSASKSSWRNFKSLNFKKDLWGLKKEFYTQSIDDRKKMLETVLRRCGKFLMSLDLEDFSSFEQDKSLNKLILNSVKTNCTNLKSFYMKREIMIDKSSIPKLKVIIKNLQNLQCKIDDKVKDKDLKLLFSSCKELETLNITTGASIIGDFLHSLDSKKIKELDLSLFESAGPIYYTAIQKFGNLERLFIVPFSDFIESSECNFECPKTLNELCIGNCDLNSLSIFSNETSLTKLQILTTDIKDSVLFKISESCPGLEFLELDANPDIGSGPTDRGIQALSVLSKLEILRLSWMDRITGSTFKYFSTLKKFTVSALSKLNMKSLCDVLITCKELEELTIDTDSYYDEGKSNNIAIDFFTLAKKLLKQRHFINNKPLKVVFFDGFIIVTSIIFKGSEKVRLFFEVYSKRSWANDNSAQKILGKKDFLQLINKLIRDGFNE